MTARLHEDAGLNSAIAAGRERFRQLPERIRPEDTFISVPVTAPRPARDAYDPDGWMVRNLWCGSLL